MVILIAVSLVLGDDQCAHHSTGTSITSQGQGDCLLHEPQTSWQCSSSSWSYESLCWAKFSCDSHEKNIILQDVVSFNNCPRHHQFPNAKELKALSFRHTLLVQCWLLTLSEWKVLSCVLADEGHNFLHFTKRPYCRSRARAKQYTVYHIIS